jgi:heme/copper-type cytochrome/quinol oxidase subunit 2
MKERILGLVGLGLGAAVSLLVCAYWAKVLSSAAAQPARDNAEYRAYVWLGSFVLCAAAWIWLLVKTVRYRRSEQYS